MWVSVVPFPSESGVALQAEHFCSRHLLVADKNIITPCCPFPRLLSKMFRPQQKGLSTFTTSGVKYGPGSQHFCLDYCSWSPAREALWCGPETVTGRSGAWACEWGHLRTAVLPAEHRGATLVSVMQSRRITQPSPLSIPNPQNSEMLENGIVRSH